MAIDIGKILIGIFICVVVAVIFFEVGNEINESFMDSPFNSSTSINSTYMADYNYTETNDLLVDISEQSPGSSGTDFSSTADVDLEMGYRTSAIIYRAPTIVKTIFFGQEGDEKLSVVDGLFIDSRFIALAVTGLTVLIALILISSFLRNKITGT